MTNTKIQIPARQSIITIIDTYETIEELANDLAQTSNVQAGEFVFNSQLGRWCLKINCDGNISDKD